MLDITLAPASIGLLTVYFNCAKLTFLTEECNGGGRTRENWSCLLPKRHNASWTHGRTHVLVDQKTKKIRAACSWGLVARCDLHDGAAGKNGKILNGTGARWKFDGIITCAAGYCSQAALHYPLNALKCTKVDVLREGY